jgi:small subunit ribosomal protein S20
MPNTSSARKAMRQAATNKARNVVRKEAYKKAVKDVRKTITKDAASAADPMKNAFKALDKAAKRGVIKPNKASRLKSRAAKALAKASK